MRSSSSSSAPQLLPSPPPPDLSHGVCLVDLPTCPAPLLLSCRQLEQQLLNAQSMTVTDNSCLPCMHPPRPPPPPLPCCPPYRQVEQQLLKAQSGVIPRQFMALEAEYNAQLLQQQQQQSGESPAAAAEPQQQQQQQQYAAFRSMDVLSSMEDDEGLVETDLDMPLLSWLGVKVMVPQEGKVRGVGGKGGGYLRVRVREGFFLEGHSKHLHGTATTLSKFI